MGPSPHDKPIGCITGAHTGTGCEAARPPAQRGLVVLRRARDPQWGAEAATTLRGAGIGTRPMRLGGTDAQTNRAAVHPVERAYGTLDVLGNHAGVALDRGVPPSAVPAAGLRRTSEATVWGPVAGIHDCLLLLKRSAAGRMVHVSSA